MTHQLISQVFYPAFRNPLLEQDHDGCVFLMEEGRLAYSTDSFVVDPIFFPGGDIGDLAINGTVNDLACCGARPLYLTAGFILEEGLPLADLQRIVQSMKRAAERAGVQIVAGDTKVVERGKCDKLFINTSGIGIVPPGIRIAPDQATPGDVVICSGPIGLHGITILSARESLGFESPIVSDTAALHGLIAAMRASGAEIHVLRDPTRGGLATTLNEIARQSGVGMMLQEKALPVTPAVGAACEFLGLDPLYVANEGKLVAICPESDAETLLNAMRSHPLGKDAAIVGSVHEDPHHFVQMTTAFGGKRIVDWLSGEQLPRIC